MGAFDLLIQGLAYIVQDADPAGYLRIKADLVGHDDRKDLALVKFTTKDKDIKIATLGDSSSLHVGDWAIAIGSPFGYGTYFRGGMGAEAIRELLAAVDVLVVNEGELALVANCQGTVAQCLDRLAVPTVVVTLGSRGCCARVGKETLVQCAFGVKPVDTTGAGDAFAAGLLIAMADGADPVTAAANGHAVAAAAVRRASLIAG